MADVITLHDEIIDDSEPYVIFDPEHTWKRKTIENFTARPLLEKLFENGKCLYREKTVSEIRDICAERVDELWSEVCRFENQHKYYVDLSEKLWTVKKSMLDAN